MAFGVGPIVDNNGQRKGIIIAVVGAAISSLLTVAVGWVLGIAAGLGFVLLILVRSLAGPGYAEQAINATYLGEMFAPVYSDPAKARRRASSIPSYSPDGPSALSSPPLTLLSSFRLAGGHGPLWSQCSRRSSSSLPAGT